MRVTGLMHAGLAVIELDRSIARSGEALHVVPQRDGRQPYLPPARWS
jgi:hypothetical protein